MITKHLLCQLSYIGVCGCRVIITSWKWVYFYIIHYIAGFPPTKQFSTAIVILCEVNRNAHIIWERPGHLCGWPDLNRLPEIIALAPRHPHNRADGKDKKKPSARGDATMESSPVGALAVLSPRGMGKYCHKPMRCRGRRAWRGVSKPCAYSARPYPLRARTAVSLYGCHGGLSPFGPLPPQNAAANCRST